MEVANGRIISTHIPYVPIFVDVPEEDLTAEFTALVDTGFDAEIIVPRAAITSGRPALIQSDIRLADGSRLTVPSYLGSLRIGATAISPVLVLAIGDEAVVGLAVITRFRLIIDHERTLTLEP